MITVRAATRVDLAGGTLDLWPLTALIPGAATLNCAIDLWAAAEAGPGGVMRNEDSGRTLAEGADPFADPDFALAAECLRQFAPGRKVSLLTRTLAPRGSGLGNSSALAVAIALALLGLREPEALAELDETRAHGLVAILRDLEARVLRTPTGTQDYYPALLGGLNLLHFRAGRIEIEPIPVDLDALADRLTVFDTRLTHHSGMNNWAVYKAAIDGDSGVLAALRAIADTAHALAASLRGGDWVRCGALLDEEWAARRRLSAVVSGPQPEAQLAAARGAGAWGGKLCGAGGGGCGIVLHPPERRAAVAAALSAAGARPLAARPSAAGFSAEFA